MWTKDLIRELIDSVRELPERIAEVIDRPVKYNVPPNPAQAAATGRERRGPEDLARTFEQFGRDFSSFRATVDKLSRAVVKVVPAGAAPAPHLGQQPPVLNDLLERMRRTSVPQLLLPPPAGPRPFAQGQGQSQPIGGVSAMHLDTQKFLHRFWGRPMPKPVPSVGLWGRPLDGSKPWQMLPPRKPLITPPPGMHALPPPPPQRRPSGPEFGSFDPDASRPWIGGRGWLVRRAQLLLTGPREDMWGKREKVIVTPPPPKMLALPPPPKTIQQILREQLYRLHAPATPLPNREAQPWSNPIHHILKQQMERLHGPASPLPSLPWMKRQRHRFYTKGGGKRSAFSMFHKGMRRGMGYAAVTASARRMRSAAFGAGRLAGKAMASPILGPLAALGGGIALMAKVAEKMMQFARDQSQANRGDSRFSFETASAFARADFASFARNINMASRTSGTAVSLAESVRGMDDAAAEYKAAVTNIKNKIGTSWALGITPFLGLFSGVPKAANDWMQGRPTEGDILARKYWEQLPTFEKWKMQARVTFGGHESAYEYGEKVRKWADENNIKAWEDPLGDAMRAIVQAGGFNSLTK